MRKLCTMKLFNRKRIKSWQLVCDKVDAAMCAITASTWKPVNIRELFNLKKNIIYRAMFRSSSREGEEAKLNDESDKLQNSIRLTEDNIKAIIMDNLDPKLRCSMWIPL
ncbi:coniferylaldehyde 5-hydroxylase [Spatholobus suberectus]|nr:coniferylaldehyde 5-hydroxylase [Spatholobus suberectus]